MNRTVLQSRTAAFASSSAFLIGAGLAILIAATWIPAVPVVTAFAILALGATEATLARFRSSPALVSIVLLHAATYAALYGLFIGATFHAAYSTGNSLDACQALDLIASAFLMAIALQRTIGVLSRR